MMMNVVALWILFSTIGAANVMFPDQSVTKASRGEQHPLEEAKGAAAESLRHVLEAARQTGDGIRETASSASHVPKRTADAVQHFGADVAQVVKDGSQSGLEKIGLARPEEKSYSEIIKEDALNAYGWTTDAAGDTSEAIGDRVRQAASATKDKLTDTAGFAKEKGSETVDLVGDSASKIPQSLQDNFNTAEGKAAAIVRSISLSLQENFNVAEGKASEIARSAYDHARDAVKGSAEEADHIKVDPSIPTYKDKIKHASEQAADVARNRATEAASVLPNLGQGLGYLTKDAERIAAEGKEKLKPGFFGKITEHVKDVEHAAESCYECAKDSLRSRKEQTVDKASNLLNEAGEEVRQTKDAAEDIAREGAGKIIDRTRRTKHNIAKTTADAAHTLKNTTLEYYQKLKAIAAASLLVTCRAAHLFFFSSVYGSSLWVTFISGYLLARSIPRQQFALVQSRIFPAYLRVAATGQAVCLVLFLILRPWPNADRDEKLQHLDLLAVLVSTLANAFYLEPRATKAMFEKLKTEKEESKGQDGFTSVDDAESEARLAKLDNKFSRFHGYSSIANLLSLIGLTWHLLHLSRRLVV